VGELLARLASGELREVVEQHYFGLLQRMVDASVSRPRGLGLLVAAGYRLVSLLGVVPGRVPGAGSIVRDMNMLMLLDMVYGGREYGELVEVLDEEGRQTLSEYLCVLACNVGLEELCCSRRMAERGERLASVRRRVRVARRLRARHTCGRRFMLLEVFDNIGPPRILSDSLDIVVESLASLTPGFLRRVTGEACSLAVVDVGAYNGETSMRYAALAESLGARSLVYAVEPDPVSYRVLSFNARLLGYPVVPVNAFLSDREGVEELVSRGPSSSMGSLAGRRGGVAVKVLPAWRVASEAVSRLPGAHLHVRIDTEGAEGQVVKGLLPILERVEGFSVEVAVYHRLGDLLRFYRVFSGHADGFTLTWSSLDFRDLMLVAYRWGRR